MVALEDRIDANLRGGQAGELVPELTELIGSHPYRELFGGQLMLALYRGGRPAEALAAYRAAREMLRGDATLTVDRNVGSAEPTGASYCLIR